MIFSVEKANSYYFTDYQSRRISKQVDTTPAIYYIYDGWNMLADYTIQNSLLTVQHSYTWGMDLSGSMQGAGGVGGLLAVTDHGSLPTDHSYYPTYDGNGNVSEYLDAAGTTVAHYEYDTFGNEIVAATSGSLAQNFAHRFSTKYLDDETGLYYYGYRYYDPVTGRWPSRDPIEEQGGYNLYGFVGNAPLKRIDFLGWRSGDVDQGGGSKTGCSAIDLQKVFHAKGNVAGKVDWKVETSLIIKGEKCCIVCKDGSEGYTASVSITGSAKGELGFAPWRIAGSTKARYGIWLSWDGWIGGRIFAGVSGSVQGKGSYNSCEDKIEWGADYALALYAGVNVGASLTLEGFVDIWPFNFDFKFGVAATVTGRLTGRWRPTISCSGNTCTFGGKTTVQADLEARFTATVGRWSISGSHKIGDTGEMDAGYLGKSFANPISRF